MVDQIKSTVVIAGAGPGDPELITMKAMKAIRDAEVILYDALVNKELLNYASADCILVYVGKRKGCHEYSQDKINQLLLFYAGRFHSVLRLKGGDPFVFGRGSEEAEYLTGHGVHVKIIPGISSAIAAPSSIGIPVTRRNVSESFWVVTGTTTAHQLSKDVYLAAQSSATVVILMGMSHLTEIIASFKKFRDEDEPVAIIQNASLKNEASVIGVLGNIAELASENHVVAPAVIVIGKVVDHARMVQILPQEKAKMKVAV